MDQYARLLVPLVVVVALLATAPAGVAAQPADSTNQSAFPVTLTDATGTEVTLDERPERVTTTSPSAAQVMWELDADSQVVGLTQFAHYLEGAESRQNVSSTELGVSVERVVATEPDLVLAPNATSVETVEALRDAGLTVYHFPAATDFEDVADKTSTIGQLTGNEQAARETNAWMWHNVEAIEAMTAEADSPRVLYPLSGGFAVGNDTFIHEIIVASGGENVAADEFDGYEVLNDETVLTLDPEVLIVTDQTEGQIIDSDPYAQTTAGETQRTASLEVSYLNQPAPRSVVYSTRNLTAQLHIESTGTDTPTANESAAESTGVSAPGFGPAVALMALLSGSLLARRRVRS
ncbi:MAG: PGF-CTERM-anchored ABC transporter substrate-binding protein [Halohasta sp.]